MLRRHRRAWSTELKNLITCIDADDPAVQARNGERIFDDLGEELELAEQAHDIVLG
jgi:hypothetical protein